MKRLGFVFMDQLIQQLQYKVASLLQELDDAHAEIARLKNAASATDSENTTSPYDLLSQMSNLTPNDQLQLYIEDSLDSDSSDSIQTTNINGDFENQLSFDLPPETGSLGSILDTTEPTLSIQNNAYATENQVTLKDSSNNEEQVTENTIINKSKENDIPEVEETSTTLETESSDTSESQQLAKKRKKNKQNNIKLIQLLEKKYPKAFNWNNPSPLKIGIDKEMQIDDELTESKLKRALAAYTRSDRYKKSLTKQKLRIDLNGKPILPKKAAHKPSKEKATDAIKKEPRQTEPKQEAPKDDGLSNEERMKKKLAMLLSKNKH